MSGSDTVRRAQHWCAALQTARAAMQMQAHLHIPGAVLPGIAGILPSASGQVNMFKCERDYFSLHSPLIKEVLERCCERMGMYFKVVLD